ncbi:hypothetical protein ACH4YO_31995 [Streptomyces noursei]|uniref:hypothetical protein n=1 Tax=Streptomyces noursei TaxID=1971 RepID=UPI00340F4E3C
MIPADPSSRERSAAPRLDIIGLALLGPAFAILAFALSQAAGDAGFGAAPVIVALVLGAVLLAAYCAHAARVGAKAIIRLNLFRSRGFAASVTVMGLTGTRPHPGGRPHQ